MLTLDVAHTLLEDFHRLLICADDSVELSIVELSGSTVLLLPQEGGDETAIGIARSPYSFANDVPYTQKKMQQNLSFASSPTDKRKKLHCKYEN